MRMIMVMVKTTKPYGYDDDESVDRGRKSRQPGTPTNPLTLARPCSLLTLVMITVEIVIMSNMMTMTMMIMRTMMMMGNYGTIGVQLTY